VPKIGLTDLSVRSLKEGLYFDTKTPAFGIRVGKNRKTWLVVKGDNRTKVRLGHYPELSLQDARRRALVALGTPLAAKTTLTFPEALELFLGQDRWKASVKRRRRLTPDRRSILTPLWRVSREAVLLAVRRGS